jgi:hypothetical protein
MHEVLNVCRSSFFHGQTRVCSHRMWKVVYARAGRAGQDQAGSIAESLTRISIL